MDEALHFVAAAAAAIGALVILVFFLGPRE
jgi:hypothetical protein